MKKIIFIFGIFVCILLFFAGCSEQKKSVNPTKNLEYKNTEYNFGINPPENWTTDENDNYGVVRFYGPTVVDFTVNFGISEPFSLGNENLKTTVETVLDSYKSGSSGLTNFTEISKSSTKVNGMNSYNFVYSYTLQGYTVYGKQVLVEKDKNVVILTYSASKNSFSEYEDEFNKSLNTFTFL